MVPDYQTGTYKSVDEIAFCPLHEAAPAMLEALKTLSEFWAYGLDKLTSPDVNDIRRAEELGKMCGAVIAKAERS